MSDDGWRRIPPMAKCGRERGHSGRHRPPIRDQTEDQRLFPACGAAYPLEKQGKRYRVARDGNGGYLAHETWDRRYPRDGPKVELWVQHHLYTYIDTVQPDGDDRPKFVDGEWSINSSALWCFDCGEDEDVWVNFTWSYDPVVTTRSLPTDMRAYLLACPSDFELLAAKDETLIRLGKEWAIRYCNILWIVTEKVPQRPFEKERARRIPVKTDAFEPRLSWEMNTRTFWWEHRKELMDYSEDAFIKLLREIRDQGRVVLNECLTVYEREKAESKIEILGSPVRFQCGHCGTNNPLDAVVCQWCFMCPGCGTVHQKPKVGKITECWFCGRGGPALL
jgi:hypothetical protein